MKPLWLQIALAEIEKGVIEIPGKPMHPRIRLYFESLSARALQGLEISDELPWCPVYTNFCLITAGEDGLDTLVARDWLKYGIKLKAPKIGAIVVFPRGNKNSWMGHVGIINNIKGSQIETASGNVNNRVKLKWYSTGEALGFRWPDTKKITTDKKIQETEIPIRIPESAKKEPELIPEKKMNLIEKKKPFWKQDGFKRGVAVIIGTVGLIVRQFEPVIGNVIEVLAGLIGGWGLADAVRKSNKRTNNNTGLVQSIINFLTELFNQLVIKLKGNKK